MTVAPTKVAVQDARAEPTGICAMARAGQSPMFTVTPLDNCTLPAGRTSVASRKITFSGSGFVAGVDAEAVGMDAELARDGGALWANEPASEVARLAATIWRENFEVQFSGRRRTMHCTMVEPGKAIVWPTLTLPAISPSRLIRCCNGQHRRAPTSTLVNDLFLLKTPLSAFRKGVQGKNVNGRWTWLRPIGGPVRKVRGAGAFSG